MSRLRSLLNIISIVLAFVACFAGVIGLGHWRNLSQASRTYYSLLVAFGILTIFGLILPVLRHREWLQAPWLGLLSVAMGATQLICLRAGAILCYTPT